MVFNILLVAKMTEKLDHYVDFFQKWVHTEEILMKLNVRFFIHARKKVIKPRIRLAMVWKMNLIVSLYKINNMQKLKQSLMKKNSAQIFIMIKYQTKVLNTFVFQ